MKHYVGVISWVGKSI